MSKLTEDKNKILCGDCFDILKTLPAESVQCCVTSPPYWGLRDYGVEGQLGLEKTPEEYVEKMVAVFEEVRRVLRKDGTLWLNLGDTYAANRTTQVIDNKHVDVGNDLSMKVPSGLKQKDLCGIPWRVAFALQSAGWYLRQDIIWHKPNPMPESVTDRCTKAHEYVFLMAKSGKYFYDADALREPCVQTEHNLGKNSRVFQNRDVIHSQKYREERMDESFNHEGGRNRRSVWTIATAPFPAAHFATFPEALVEPCILAGSRCGDTVLDPFSGAGTVGVVAKRLNRKYIGIELNPEYVKMAENRIRLENPQLNFD